MKKTFILNFTLAVMLILVLTACTETQNGKDNPLSSKNNIINTTKDNTSSNENDNFENSSNGQTETEAAPEEIGIDITEIKKYITDNSFVAQSIYFM
jgi:outer membrane biogenesis lipoprotein LolB